MKKRKYLHWRVFPPKPDCVPFKTALSLALESEGMWGFAAVDTSQSKGLIPFPLTPDSPDGPTMVDDPPKWPKVGPKPIRAKPPLRKPLFPPVVPVPQHKEGKITNIGTRRLTLFGVTFEVGTNHESSVR